MKRIRIAKAIVVLIVLKVVLDLTFKIQYSKNEYFEISEFQLSDSTYVESGKILFGKNVKGNIEAIIYPDKFIQNGMEDEVEYVYMRFYPEWFKTKLKPRITKIEEKVVEELLSTTRNIHEDNFRSYMHFNNYPIIKKDFVPIVVKKNDMKEKVSFTYSL